MFIQDIVLKLNASKGNDSEKIMSINIKKLEAVLLNRKGLAAVFVILLICIGVFYFWSESKKEANKDTYVLGKVSRSNISMIIDATGTIQPVNSVDLSATASGTLEAVYVTQNQKVAKGEILASIESKALTSSMKQAQNTLRNKESYYLRLSDLYKQGAVSYQIMDDARLSYLNAQAAYDKAEADLNDTVITSPMDGTIVGEPMKVGETVSQGLSNQMVIVRVADLSSMKIELLVDETDIGEVRLGQKVSFTVDAYPGRLFHGIVSDISQKRYSGSAGSTASSSVVYYTVYVDVNTEDLDGLYPSMTARAEISGQEKENTLVVPITAIRSDAKGSYVYVKGEEGLSKVYVNTGITTDKEVEVISGVNEGDEIVISGTVSQEKDSTTVTKVKHRGPI